MAPYKKSLKDLISPLYSSTRAGFCLSLLSERRGLPEAILLFSKQPADGQKSLLYRQSGYRPKKDESHFISAFILCAISVTPRLWGLLNTFSNTLKEDLFFCGTLVLSTGQRLSKSFLKAIGVFTRIPFQGTPLNLTLMSLYGCTLNALHPTVFQKIFMISRIPFQALPGSSRNLKICCGRVSEHQSFHGVKCIPITFANVSSTVEIMRSSRLEQNRKF